MVPEVSSAKSRLDAIFAKVDQFPNADAEILSHWAKYLCVLTSGFLEQALRLTLSDFAKRKAHPAVARHVTNSLRTLSNINGQKLLELLTSFSNEWRMAYAQTLQDRCKDHIDTLVANRHLIVHGRSVSMSLHDVKEYHRSVIAVVEWIDTICNP